MHPDRPGRFRALIGLCLEGPVVRRAATTALLVGVILAVINHGDALAAGRIDVALASRITLTFAVPYLVSTISSALAIERHRGAAIRDRAVAPPDVHEALDG